MSPVIKGFSSVCLSQDLEILLYPKLAKSALRLRRKLFVLVLRDGALEGRPAANHGLLVSIVLPSVRRCASGRDRGGRVSCPCGDEGSSTLLNHLVRS